MVRSRVKALVSLLGAVLFAPPLDAERLAGLVELHPGLNLYGVPVEPLRVPNVASLLRQLDPVSEILRLESSTQQFQSCTFVNGQPVGEACVQPVVAGEGLFIYAGDKASVAYDVVFDCPDIALSAGLNLVSFPCAASDLKVLTLLRAIGDTAPGGTIQTFDTDTGRWISAVNNDGSSIDVDFPIVIGNAYLVHLPAALTLTPPIADAGPDQIGRLGERVIFDGSDSMPPGLEFCWALQKPLNSNAALDYPCTPMPSFVPDVDGDYRGTLVVSDGISRATDQASVPTILSADSDLDGINNGEEVITYGTDPLNPDSDGDGFSDGFEINEGESDPLDNANLPAAIVRQSYGATVAVLNTAPPDQTAYGPMISVFNSAPAGSVAYGPMVSVFNGAP